MPLIWTFTRQGYRMQVAMAYRTRSPDERREADGRTFL